MPFREGQTATNQTTGEKAVFEQGKWRSLGRPPVGATLRTDYGRGAFQTREGDIAQPGVHGQTVILRKSTRDDSKRVADAQTNAHNLNVAAQAAQDFMGHYPKLKLGTGLAYGFPGVGHSIENVARNTYDPELAAMDSINSRVAPQLRPVGTGRLQQNELQRFYDSLPSVGDSKAANSAKAAQLQAEAARAAHYAAHLSQYHSQHGNLDGADEEWMSAPGAAPTPPSAPMHAPAPSSAAAPAASVSRLRFDPKSGSLEPVQ